MGNYALRIGHVPVPAWRVGLGINSIKNLASTAWPYQASIINAWGGFAYVPELTTLVSPANGGHNDSSDNRVAILNFNAASPAWATVNQPTPDDGSRTPNVEYYTDGKPISRHGYRHCHYIPQRRRVMLFGGFGTFDSGLGSEAVDGISIDTWAWDPAGTWSDLLSGRGYGQVVIPTSGNVWTNGGWLWNQAANTWSQPGTQQISGNTRAPWTWDSTDNTIFNLQWSDDWGFGPDAIICQSFDPTTGARTTITLNSSSALTQLLADEPTYAALTYDSHLNCYYFYSGHESSGASGVIAQVPSRIYKITKGSPNYDISIMTVTGDAPANVYASGSGPVYSTGPNSRFVYLPEYTGIYCQPNGTSAGWFMRTS